MAKGFKHGGGGGAALNFTVVGGRSQPARAKENTIWVNTDQKITSWVFSATEPTEPSEGMVWFYTGTSSAVAFNALTKNEIQVYPFGTKQYTNGVWVEKTAMTYQNGEWMSWGDYAIQEGIAKYAFMTMSWKQYNVTATQNENSYQITVSGTDPAGCGVIYANEYKGISLANASKVVLDVAGITGSPTVKIKVWVGNNLPSTGSYASYVEAELAAEALVTVGHNELDLTGFSEGTYTVGIYIMLATELTIQNFVLQ
jgi:hypothetical protein